MIAACSTDAPNDPLLGPIAVPSPVMLSLHAGDTASVGLPGAPGVSGTVRWKTTDSSIVRVDTASVIGARVGVRAIGPGQAAIIADAATSDGQRILATIPVAVIER